MGIINLLGAAHSAAEIAELNERKRLLIPELRAQIEAEGGTVEQVWSLNSRLIVRSPFPRKLIRLNTIGGRPVLLQLRCRYAGDSGHWFVHAPSRGETLWVWKSDGGLGKPPTDRAGNVIVKNDVLTFPFWVGALLYLALIAIVFTGVLYFFGQRRS